MKPAFRIAALCEADLPELAETHVRTWQEAYVGQMPQDFLDSLNVEKSLINWQSTFAKEKDKASHGVLVARTDIEMAGFLSYGPARDTGMRESMEIYAINIRKAFWHAGIGYKLFKQACDVLKTQGEKQTYLWVLDTNKNAIDAYARWGGKIEPERIKEIYISAIKLRETRVRFDLG